MKPFNLEEAKAGKPVCTRDGRDARIICWDMNCYDVCGHLNPIIALIKDSKGDETVEIFMPNGRYWNDKNNSQYDLFMKGGEPTLDDYTTIKTYEDACKALGEKPLDPFDIPDIIPAHIIALMKLETISRALWGREWQPKPDAEGRECYWFPWFALYTEEEIVDVSEKSRNALLSVTLNDGSYAGFGCLYTLLRSSSTPAYFGFRLCQETEEKATYFGEQFVELWAEYLKFNFEIRERLV